MGVCGSGPAARRSEALPLAGGDPETAGELVARTLLDVDNSPKKCKSPKEAQGHEPGAFLYLGDPTPTSKAIKPELSFVPATSSLDTISPPDSPRPPPEKTECEDEVAPKIIKAKSEPLLLPSAAVRSRQDSARFAAAPSESPGTRNANDGESDVEVNPEVSNGLCLPMIAKTKSAPLLLPSAAVRSRRDAHLARFDAAAAEVATPRSSRAADTAESPCGFGGAATPTPASPTAAPRASEDARGGEGEADARTPRSAMICRRKKRRSVTFGEAQIRQFRVDADADEGQEEMEA